MNVRLSRKEKQKLLDFKGYGNLDAPVWFIGMEERGHGEDRLARRLKFERVEDLGRAHALLGIAKHHFPPYTLEPTWRTMSEIMLRLANSNPTKDNLKWYQATQLGRFDSDTFLTELLPIPAPSRRDWEYARLFGKREEYETEVRPARIKMLRRLLSRHKPALVICYGSDDWKYLQELFPAANWEDKKPFRLARDRATVAILSPHFVAHGMGHPWIKQLCRLIAGLLDHK